MRATLADRAFDILEPIRDIEKGLADVSYDRFRTDVLLRSAVEQLIAIICRASKYIPQEIKAAHSDIPWEELVAFGNRLYDEYYDIDPATVWQFTQQNLDPLKRLVEQIIRDAGETP